jgi:hypothetical protein
MKVNIDNKITVGDVEPGKEFTYNGHRYMRIQTVGIKPDNFNYTAVILDGGGHVYSFALTLGPVDVLETKSPPSCKFHELKPGDLYQNCFYIYMCLDDGYQVRLEDGHTSSPSPNLTVFPLIQDEAFIFRHKPAV